jgi:glucosamine--fructose-6-phosphate aminotransferase (isomerizing)
MCGIIGYIGNKQGQTVLLNSLKRLEYRGYDSAGACVFSEAKQAILVRKLPGKVKNLQDLLHKRPLTGSLALGHVRWATHGAPNQINAHPHLDCKGEIAVVHNGIIENYAQLKQDLIKEGHKFVSQTDTEVIAHLIEKFYRGQISLEAATQKAIAQLQGAFAIGVISARHPDRLIGARSGSPLVVGIGKEENFLASDISALLDYTKEVIFLEDNEAAILTKDSAVVSKFSGEIVQHATSRITWDVTEAQKQGWSHFMLKEINEQPKVLEGLLGQRITRDKYEILFEELKISPNSLASKDSITIVACGTAYHAGLCGKYIIEELCGIPVTVDLSSEFRYRKPIINKNTLVIAISQSGETADTLAAVKEAKQRQAEVLAVCNVLGSSLTRQSDGVIYTHAGPEIGVASTKAYTAQLAVMYLFGLYLAKARGSLQVGKIVQYIDSLQLLPRLQQVVLKKQDSVKAIARRHSHFGSFLFLGRHINYPLALEGALKLKEISYIPAEGYAAGEMKHGPIALIDEYRAVVCIAVESAVYEKMISNIQEIRSRKGKIIIIATEADTKVKEFTPEVIYLPKVDAFFSPLIVALPLQLLAYYVAVKRGCDVDQPRNLAKSVTVE